MLSRIADVLVPSVGRLSVTTDPGFTITPGSLFVANRTSLADPAIVLAALHRLGAHPAVMAAAGPWRIPVLGRVLAHEGHIPVVRGDRQAAAALDLAAQTLEQGRSVLIYAEGGLPRRRDAAEAAPGSFRSGVARLADRTGAPLVPVGQAGARRISSGGAVKQFAGLATAPLRRPGLHVHVGAPVDLAGHLEGCLPRARTAATAAWRTAAGRLGEAAGLAAQDTGAKS
ncbi:lysophospholipid acyltransferase family protein [Streptomyces sp. NPDC007088]|uniref:lysophospholipid acyltransferase family protein n=1 Tax=Streptomyces sp. NPDC007088 TaxID=3364773 RepID=UPI003676C1A4